MGSENDLPPYGGGVRPPVGLARDFGVERDATPDGWDTESQEALWSDSAEYARSKVAEAVWEANAAFWMDTRRNDAGRRPGTCELLNFASRCRRLTRLALNNFDSV